ncbi:unnamed protein product [Agarophyton chilense]
MVTQTDLPMSAPATEHVEGESQPRQFGLPTWVTAPVECVFATVGNSTSAISSWASTRGAQATSRARPWLEFFDLSAFGLAEGGISGCVDRLKINIPYFLFNYVLIGLIMTVLSVITKVGALIGTLVVVWIYFQFFGVEHENEDYQIMGFSLDTSEKIGFLVLLGGLVFWFTAGGIELFFEVLTAIAFVAILHGSFRKPSPNAIPPV